MTRAVAVPRAATTLAPARPPRSRAWLAALSVRHDYTLAIPDGERRRLAAAWLLLGVAALVGSGLYSLLLVAARTPFLVPLFPAADFFHTALVVHVDLSVLVWFVACAGMLWTLSSTERALDLAWASFVLALLGTAVMMLAPFVGEGRPVMSNYVPVLDEPVFLFGLMLFGLGFAGTSVRALLAPERVGVELPPAGALRFGLNGAAVAAALTMCALVWSWRAVPHDLAGKPYYELLFWGPGHVVQFAWTLVMLVAWLWLASASGARVPLSPRVATLVFGVGLVSVFATPVIYLAWDVTAVEHQKMFTWLMRFGGGLAILPMALAIVAALLRAGPLREAETAPSDGRLARDHGASIVRAGSAHESRRAASSSRDPTSRPASSRDGLRFSEAAPLRAALIASLVLFAAGGGIGFLIQGSDVRVPAHYHGAIVGITLALMGLVYALLPRLGLGTPGTRLAHWQPYIYGTGQLLHILGLVWSGGYGVQRKVAGAAQVLRTPQEVAGMALMGIGGLVAVVGGVLFIVVVLRAVARPVHRSPAGGSGATV